MADNVVTHTAPVTRKMQRAEELAECLRAITEVLDKYDATFGVMLQTTYAGGEAHHNPIVQVVSR